MLESIAHIMVSPISQFIFGMVIGAILIKYTDSSKVIGKGIIGASLIWLFLCSQYWFTYILIKPLERNTPPIKIEDIRWQSANAIWVLACYHFEEVALPRVSQFSDCSLERLVQAANMYRKNPLPIYLTGTSFVDGSPQIHSEIAAEFLKTMGVKQSDIIIVNKGTSTAEEMNAMGSLLNQQKVAIISSATHGRRLLSLAKQHNISSIFIPVDYQAVGEFKLSINAPAASSLMRAKRAMYEYAALIRDAIQ